MKIAKQLPQFNGERALVVVTGKQEADFFYASNGVIEKITGFKVEKPQYSDREGHFKTRGRGMTVVSGAVYEGIKEKVFQDFRREFQKSLKHVLMEITPTHIVIYAPAYVAKEVRSLFPKRIAPIIRKVVRGNYYSRHPFEFLEKL